MARVSQKDTEGFAEKLKQIWAQPERKDALRTAKLSMAEYRDRCPEAMAVLADGLEDSPQFYGVPDFDQKKVASTNVSEGMFHEVRRRSRVVGVFPSDEAHTSIDKAGEPSTASPSRRKPYGLFVAPGSCRTIRPARDPPMGRCSRSRMPPSGSAFRQAPCIDTSTTASSWEST
jgi:transposase-like protein